ncbi:cytochrome P450 [Gordonia bronchialis DSM 43247]|uniref:Cytochrome P450 n=1 Tax=Gordonia bronchialis (strain ATCC 25592 / DSM 43247 / BCRC 13721 / JCM 3198 / KCTC 3076 / NBRC 16047 / NCTC 10667) TaxID=526226 RepID=D0L3Z1_GORB4|nr:cytochrome P450 [Gordonia bronchialis]ACY23144.1 cytochrome P450 [Gordonia bronchialis DSM 43247]QGS23451.1 cytochrome P450 [Gordonia bronchialis]STQ66101.1 Steroid C27-monooxygenase [Gordonia bronchialis]
MTQAQSAPIGSESAAAGTSTSDSVAKCPFMQQDGWDFTNPDLLERGIPVQEFAQLRQTAPVWWNAQEPGKGGGFHDGGYWVISKHQHIREISKNNADWATATNGVIMRFDDEMTQDQLDVTKALLINHDPPEHTRLRKLVSKAFTPRAVQALEDKLDDAARTIVRAAADKGSGDFVHDVAVDLPLLAIADLLGVPEADRGKLFDWSNNMMNYDDPEFGEDPQMASAEILGYGYTMAEERRKCPVDDIVSTLVNADIDGQSLDETEFGFFFILLTVAGNETTRNAISHGMNAFLDHPDQWELFKKERPATAVDEIVRWATPVNCFQRTAKNDTQVGGVDIKAGERVGMFYGSANYDEEVFDDPFSFNILRDPNPHVGFGGNGAHFCVGANLARMEINLMFNALADIVPDITKLDAPRRLRHGWINGVKELRVDYGTK